jgi:hypothetical protein
MISGVFFGVAFGIGGLGAAALGKLADTTSIEFVYQVCAFLPTRGRARFVNTLSAIAARAPCLWRSPKSSLTNY